MVEFIGIDLDKTLAKYEPGDYHRYGPQFIGEPIPLMVEFTKGLISSGEVVKIFTARVQDATPETIKAIEDWCLEHIGQVLEITNVKDRDMKCLYDDRAVGVVANSGELKLFTFKALRCDH